MCNSSTVAGAGPSSLKRTRVGAQCTAESGTSNVPALNVSLRPDGRSAVALPTETITSRPTTWRLRSASRSAGRSSTGRTTQPLAKASIDSPSSGIGGPGNLSVSIGAFTAITIRSSVPPVRCSLTHLRTGGAMKTGHKRLIASPGMRVPARPARKRTFGEEKSTLPDMATPTAVLPRSPSSTAKRRRATS